MTEQDYIDSTNLAKIRACKTILYDTLFMEPRDGVVYQRAMMALRKLEARLEKIIKVEPGERYEPPTSGQQK